jgi:hypothetical protein
MHPSPRVSHPHQEITMQRILIVTCIIAALILTAFKPARGATTAASAAGGRTISIIVEH